MRFELPSALAARFTIRSLLGGGATGKVLLVRDRDLERNAVLKLVPLPENRYRTELAERVLQEARILASLRHPRVVTLLDFGREGDSLFLLYPDEAGRDLMSATPSKGLWRADEAILLLDQILDGLAHLHDHGIVHRDLKPANVLRIDQGEYKLIDLGLAKDTLHGKDLTGTEVFVGTPVYASPEQVSGERPDPRDDLYSLGVVVYQLVTGVNPFAADDLRGVLQRQLVHVPPPAHEVTPAVPLALSRFLERLMTKDREGRPADARTAREALSQLNLSGTPSRDVTPARTEVLPETTPPTPTEPTAEPAPRSRRAPWLPLGALLLLGGGTLVALLPTRTGPAAVAPRSPEPSRAAATDLRSRALASLSRALTELEARDASLRAGDRPAGELGTMVQLEGLLGGSMNLVRLVRRAAETASGRSALREWLAGPISDTAQGLATARRSLDLFPDPTTAVLLADALDPLGVAFHGGFAEEIVEPATPKELAPARAYLEATALALALDARGLQGRAVDGGRARERRLWRHAETGPQLVAGYAAWRRVRSLAQSGGTRSNLLRTVHRTMDPEGVRIAYREVVPRLEEMADLPRALLLAEVLRIQEKNPDELALGIAERTDLEARFASTRAALAPAEEERLATLFWDQAFLKRLGREAAQSTP